MIREIHRSVIKALDGCSLDRTIHAPGWNFFFMAAEVKVMIFGAIGATKVQSALNRQGGHLRGVYTPAGSESRGCWRYMYPRYWLPRKSWYLPSSFYEVWFRTAELARPLASALFSRRTWEMEKLIERANLRQIKFRE
jgi:hypothetical protein